jgi:hypothetical protein
MDSGRDLLDLSISRHDSKQPFTVADLRVSEGWEAVIRSSRLNDAGAPETDLSPLGFVPKEAGSKLFTRTVKAREQ